MKVFYSGGRDSHPEVTIRDRNPDIMLSFYDFKVAEKKRTMARFQKMRVLKARDRFRASLHKAINNT